METALRKQLLELSEEKYKNFSMKLTPGIDNILGVRLPMLRKVAKEISKGNWRKYLNTGEELYFEEIMLKGMVIGYADAPLEEIKKYICEFVPKINNWSVCDSFCSGLKITKSNMSHIWDFLQIYLNSEEPYHMRFGIVMLLNYYIEPEYIQRVLKILEGINNADYYVSMASAWALSICFITFPKETMIFLKTSSIDTSTYNKALQKITESLRVDKDTKAIIKGMKRI